MIQVESLAKSYTKGAITTEVLKEISFRIEEGEFVSIMGASGTGKSTLMNILGALDKPSNGRYLLDGLDVAALNDDALSELRNRTTASRINNKYWIRASRGSGGLKGDC